MNPVQGNGASGARGASDAGGNQQDSRAGRRYALAPPSNQPNRAEGRQLPNAQQTRNTAIPPMHGFGGGI